VEAIQVNTRGTGVARKIQRRVETLSAARGFSIDNLESMRRFYRAFPLAKNSETVSRNSSEPRIRQTASGKSETASQISDIVVLAENWNAIGRSS